MRTHLIAAAAVASLTIAGAAFAALPRAKALAVMHDRHEGMETIGKVNKSLHREIDASAPDMTVIKLSSVQLLQLSRKASGWFPAGTGPELGKTGAKPVIWQQPRDFHAKLVAFQQATQLFASTAQRGDVAATRASYGAMVKTCNACHDTYRMDMHH